MNEQHLSPAQYKLLQISRGIMSKPITQRPLQSTMPNGKTMNLVARLKRLVCGRYILVPDEVEVVSHKNNDDQQSNSEVSHDEQYETSNEEQCNEFEVYEPIILGDIFPDDVEQVCEPDYSIPREDRLIRRYRRVINQNNTAHSTSFLDLPQELRDEIYGYAVPTDNVYQIRVYPDEKKPLARGQRERLPKLYFALPLLYYGDALQAQLFPLLRHWRRQTRETTEMDSPPRLSLNPEYQPSPN